MGYRYPDGRADLVVDGERAVVHTWRGGARTALLLHGMLSDHRELGALPARLADAGFTVHALDFRGCGQSEGARSVQTLPRMIEDVRALVRFAGASPDLLVGHSLGAAVAIHAVADGLVKPARLVAASPPDWGAGRLAAASFVLAALPALRSLVVPLPRRYRWSVRVESARAWAESQGFKSQRFPLATWVGLREIGTERAARRVTVPALVIVTEEDRIVPPRVSRRVASAFPQAELLSVPGYHSVFLCEGAQEAIARVVAFAQETRETDSR